MTRYDVVHTSTHIAFHLGTLCAFGVGLDLLPNWVGFGFPMWMLVAFALFVWSTHLADDAEREPAEE